MTVALLLLSTLISFTASGCCECDNDLPPIAVFIRAFDADGSDITEEAVVHYEKNGGPPERCAIFWCGAGEGRYRIEAVVRGVTLVEEVHVGLSSDCCVVPRRIEFHLP